METRFGALYVHAAHRTDGSLDELRISMPGTMHGKDLGDVLNLVVESMNEIIRR